MSRLISLIVLLASIVIIGALFYKVMIGFFVPVFLAAVLVVVFRPLHRWVLEKVRRNDLVAAGITTALIIFSVLLPTALVIAMAAVQGTNLVSQISPSAISIGLNNARNRLGLQSPCQEIIRSIQTSVDKVQQEVGTSTMDDLTQPNGNLAGLIDKIHQELDGLLPHLKSHLELEADKVVEQVGAADFSAQSTDSDAPKVDTSSSLDTQSIESRRAQARQHAAEAFQMFERDWQQPLADFHASVDRIAQVLGLKTLGSNANTLLADAVESNRVDLIELQSRAVQLGIDWQATKLAILGNNRLMASLRELANPSPRQLRDATSSVINYLQPKIISITGATAEFLIRLIIGTAIMIVSIYFFLYDGPRMVESLMKLSPLDDRYEMELLTEFDRISRAIVLAMILSAIVQGLTAGLGYYMAGMPSLIFLTLLSILCGLIPFVGPSVVWVPVCVYLVAFEERYLVAALLAVWGMVAVASVDNIVKAYVLHGQSQLHPLLALLSVLGGVQALGPIGLVVGPISVVILQTLLSILQRELTHIDHSSGSGSSAGPGKSVSRWMSKLKRPQSNTAATDSNSPPIKPFEAPAS